MSTKVPTGSRRGFLKTAGIASALALPTFLPSTVLAAPDRTGANGRIRVGLIGAGTRAKWLSRAISRLSDRAELVAVCDCYLPQVDRLAAAYQESVRVEPRWTAYQDYEEMYDAEELGAFYKACRQATSKGLTRAHLPEKAPALRPNWTLVETDRDGNPVERFWRLPRLQWPGLAVFDYCGRRNSSGGRYEVFTIDRDNVCFTTGMRFSTLEALAEYLYSLV